MSAESVRQRGCDRDPSRGVRKGRQENRTPKEPTRIGDVISRLMANLGLEDDVWLSQLSSDWRSLVGDVVANHTRPGQIIGRTLVVFVDSPVWLNELQRYGRTEMLVNLQKRFGSQRIQAIRLQPDPDGIR